MRELKSLSSLARHSVKLRCRCLFNCLLNELSHQGYMVFLPFSEGNVSWFVVILALSELTPTNPLKEAKNFRKTHEKLITCLLQD